MGGAQDIRALTRLRAEAFADRQNAESLGLPQNEERPVAACDLTATMRGRFLQLELGCENRYIPDAHGERPSRPQRPVHARSLRPLPTMTKKGCSN